MNTQDTVAELERLAEAVGVKVSYEPMSGLVQGIGGLCRVRGEHRLIVEGRPRIEMSIHATDGTDNPADGGNATAAAPNPSGGANRTAERFG